MLRSSQLSKLKLKVRFQTRLARSLDLQNGALSIQKAIILTKMAIISKVEVLNLRPLDITKIVCQQYLVKIVIISNMGKIENN